MPLECPLIKIFQIIVSFWRLDEYTNYMSCHLTESFPAKLFKGESFRWHVYVASKILPCSGNVSMEILFERIIYLSACTHMIRCKT